MIKSGIYRLVHKDTDKCYIGTAKCFKSRKSAYKTLKCRNQTKIYNALVKYGWDSFRFDIIEEIQDPEERYRREEYYIKFYDSINNGYNILPGGERKDGKYNGMFNKKRPHTEKVKQRISEILKRGMTDQRRMEFSERAKKDKNGMYGKTHSPEARKKISEARSKKNN